MFLNPGLLGAPYLLGEVCLKEVFCLLFCLLGPSLLIGAPTSFWLALLMLFVYNALIILDSGSLTTGTVVNGDAHDRGVRLALHSMVGFLGGAIGGPVVGFVLDNFGGQTSHLAWFLSFLCLGLGSLVSALTFKYYFFKYKQQN